MARHPLGSLLQNKNQELLYQHQQHQQQYSQHHQIHQFQQSRLPPGFPIQRQMCPANLSQLHPQSIINHHNYSQNLHQIPLASAHLPVALNNFAMHPNFNTLRSGIHSGSLASHTQPNVHVGISPTNNSTLLLNNAIGSNSSCNMFNMRLVQEIQQNHPLLQNVSRHVQQNQNILSSHNTNTGNIMHRNFPGSYKQNYNMRRDATATCANGGKLTADGNLPQNEFDEYSNLMSTRDKHWLIGIQLSQLNTDTPYIDDYYFTIYKERKASQTGIQRHSQAHMDNQLNHPLTQPKGHAQLVLVQMGNKICNRNGQQHRETRNLDNMCNQEVKFPPYLFTPLKFENSLGKLQYGSVTAPRKIIDADIMSPEESDIFVAFDLDAKNKIKTGAKNTEEMLCETTCVRNELNTAIIAHRKSRYILLHIETLYRILLKLDDLNNPNALATIITKKNKERERLTALELLENANKTSEERLLCASNAPSLKSKFNYEIESREALLEKLVAGLHHEKVMAIMNVRKGKVNNLNYLYMYIYIIYYTYFYLFMLGLN